MYVRMGFSQKAARVFEIASFLMLVPASLGLLLAAIIFFISILSGTPALLLFAIVPFALAGLGTLLLIGYHKHALGILDDRKRLPLWAGSFVFNLMPLLPLFHYMRTTPNAHLYDGGGFIFVPVILWWISATIVSVFAFIYDYNDQKYR
ncbi:MAG: hypothetical protein IPK58_11485 [Acidobacteria bacterium]|nr:hypothetical protein [Acidobacteriota bacterium]